MNLKKYNKQTDTWDIIASGNASGIVVTDPHFVSENNTQKSVNDVLVEMDNKIEQTRRNLSWVVQNGTIGGGGGGGTSSGGTIQLTNSNITTIEGINYLYATETKVTLNYLIEASIPNKPYSLSVMLDGEYIVKNKTVYSQIPGTIEIDNINKHSNNSSHSVVIMCSDEEGISLPSYRLTIVESSISLSAQVASNIVSIGTPYSITYTILNKTLGVETHLIVSEPSVNASLDINVGSFTSSTPKIVTVNFFDLIDAADVRTGSSYQIKAVAAATVNNQQITSNETTTTVVVEDGKELVVLVNGISQEGDDNVTEFIQSGNITFSFTPYLSGVSLIYYALKIQCGEYEGGEFKPKNTTLIGNFDATLDNFTENSYVGKGNLQLFSWSIPQEEQYVGDYRITLRCWSEKGSPTKDIILVCNVKKDSNSLYDTQIPENSLYANWHIKQGSFPTNTKASQWISHTDDFIKPGELVTSSVTTTMNVYDTNGVLSGFLTENGQSKLRLSGEAYSIIDVTPFKDSDNWCQHGFTLSISFKTDLHPYNDRAVFFIGDYDDNNEFSNGIYVGLEDVKWKYYDGTTKQTLSCKIQQNVPKTIDFVVKPKSNTELAEVKIYIDGVLNVAREVISGNTISLNTTSKMYLGCVNKNNELTDFSDVEFYEIKLFRRPLNDKQIVVNTMNSKARSTLLPSGSIDFNQYNQEKKRNFFTTDTLANPLWDDLNGTFKITSYNDLISYSSSMPLPIMLIDCAKSGFTKNVYEALGKNETEYQNCTLNYYDPQTNREISTEQVSILIQGTSSTNYRSKNLDIIFRKSLIDINGNVVGEELFQPKSTWMPENQFTLKADVVDSAHANNASVGKWINDNADILFDKTPPMRELESHRPVDTYTHEEHKDVTIKHTLEGFPIILLIKFDNSSETEMLGMYSLNLGRAAYYNMGMKFFKHFTSTERQADGSLIKRGTPCFITDYESYGPNEKFGSITPSQIYSYEFGENANTISDKDDMKPLALFMQDDLSIIQHVGEFKYNGLNQDMSQPDAAVWERLRYLFTTLAEMTPQEALKYKWDVDNKDYVLKGGSYSAKSNYGDLIEQLGYRLNIRNAYSYFMICVAFGLVDSLGKNMVLRSWNVGGTETDYQNFNQWWPCFYDMDTGNGLSNTGEENVAKTAYIDGFKNKETENGVNALEIKYNDPNGGYDTYSSRLWDVLRDNLLLREGKFPYTYENIWDAWRTNSNLLSSSEQYVNNYFSQQTAGCGAILYNFDYKVKYLTKYAKDENSTASYANIEFLHGTRIDYVRDWLKKRFTFLDGVFRFANNNVLLPYNTVGQFKCGGSEEGNTALVVKLNSPAILTVNVGNTSETRHFVEENVETPIILPPLSSFNTQIRLNNTTEISKISGLKDIRFQGFMDITLPSMAEIDLNNLDTLSSKPVQFENIFRTKVGEEETESGTVNIYNSEIRHINLANTRFWSGDTGEKEFPVIINDYKKLKTLDISNSCVTSLALPNAALSELKIANSTVQIIDLVSQPFIDHVDFTGCTKLEQVTVTECSKITSLDLRNMQNLTRVKIQGCAALKSIYLSGCTKLKTIEISNASALTYIDLSNCSDPNLEIYLVGATSLNTLNLSNTTTTNPVQFVSGFNSLKNLDLRSSRISAFSYGDKISKYNGENVLDLSPFNLTSLNLTNNTSKYIKFLNSKTKPFEVNSSTFTNCGELTRVFGHIKMTTAGVFNGRTLFKIHDIDDVTGGINAIQQIDWYGVDTDTEEGRNSWNNDEDLQTNITFATTSLASSFQNTSCNIYDVYYILAKCSSIGSLESTFSRCINVKTDINNPLDRYTFKWCPNVTNINYIFYSTHVAGPLYSPTHTGDTITQYNGLLSPLKNLTQMYAAFLSSGTKYIDDLFFSKCDANTYLKINNLNALFSDNESDNVIIVSDSNNVTKDNITSLRTYARASKLLVNLPELTSLSIVFNNIDINFDLVQYTEGNTTVNYCPLIAHNKNITSISRCFRNIRGTGSLYNLFGGHEIFDDVDLFPRNIHTIHQSFSITSYSERKVYYPVHNNMFRQIANTLVYCGYNSINEASVAYVSFTGDGLNKSFFSEEGETFPYEIFTKCTKLETCPFFFYGMTFDVSPNNVELPGNIFINCPNLTNLHSCFRNIGDSNFKYTLTSKGFINCQLKDVRYIFDEPAGAYNKQGGIPYGLFYQERPQVREFKAGYTAKEAQQYHIFDSDFGTENGEWVDVYLPEAKKSGEKTTNINRTIEYMANALAHFGSPNAECYTRVVYDEIADSIESALNLNFITYNANYDPIKFIPDPLYHPNKYIPNPEYNPNTPQPGIPEQIEDPLYHPYRVKNNPTYDPYRYVWNIWMHDGVVGTYDEVEGSPFYFFVSTGVITDISKDLPQEFSDPDDLLDYDNSGQSGYDHVRMNSRNFICPPDLFKYCTTGANVDYCLSSTSDYTYTPSLTYRYNRGIYGRIPKQLFDPLTTATQLRYVFYNCFNITPYTWNKGSQRGNMLHEDTFAKVGTALQNIEGIFKGMYVPNKISFPNRLFIKNTQLKNLSWSFAACIFEDSEQQFPQTMFDNNRLIENISYMFSGATTTNVSESSVPIGQGLKMIESSLFTKTKQPNIRNVQGFLFRQSNVSGSLPVLWQYSVSAENMYNVFYGVKKSNITNIADVPTSWTTGMTE